MTKRKSYRIVSNYCVLSKKKLEEMTKEELSASLKRNDGLKAALTRAVLEINSSIAS